MWTGTFRSSAPIGRSFDKVRLRTNAVLRADFATALDVSGCVTAQGGLPNFVRKTGICTLLP
jgi:hypothetical protein